MLLRTVFKRVLLAQWLKHQTCDQDAETLSSSQYMPKNFVADATRPYVTIAVVTCYYEGILN